MPCRGGEGNGGSVSVARFFLVPRAISQEKNRIFLFLLLQKLCGLFIEQLQHDTCYIDIVVGALANESSGIFWCHGSKANGLNHTVSQ